MSCRIEKEIETLEREELNISTNEGLILNRLKAIETSPEDIIKVKNCLQTVPSYIFLKMQTLFKWNVCYM